MTPLQREPREITERCPDCHVPLHDGREMHYVKALSGSVVRTYRAHSRCTGLDPAAQMSPFLRDDLPTEE